jgi:hypothetical protein
MYSTYKPDLHFAKSLLVSDVCLTMKYLLSKLTDMALMKQQLKESSEDKTKTQITTDGRYVVRATGAQVSEGNDTYIMLTQLHLLPPSSHHFPLRCCC